MKTATKVRVTATLIRTGLAGDCHRCAVALAVAEATGDDECMMAEVDWLLRLSVWGRWIAVPYEVRRFVHAVDGLRRKADGRPKLPRRLAEELAPFEFTLPAFDDPAWDEQCERCGAIFDPAEIDDEGRCEDCRKEKSD
jgi:hypothetical protein